MRIKKGDKVIVITGEYKGVEGEVLKSFPKANTVIVEKVNFMKKHQRPTQQNQEGGIFEIEAPIDVSNVKFVCPHCSAHANPKKKTLKDKTRTRYCPECEEIV